jgi:hypothetical protein
MSGKSDLVDFSWTDFLHRSSSFSYSVERENKSPLAFTAELLLEQSTQLIDLGMDK